MMDKNAISKILELSNKDYFIVHLKFVGSILPNINLTPMEIEVLAAYMAMMNKHPDWKNNIFVGKIRSQVRAMLGMTNPNMANFISKLEKKGCIIMDAGVKRIHPVLFPRSNDEQVYMFKISNNGE